MATTQEKTVSQCLFCGIAAGEIPAEVIYDDSNAVAFLDIRPRAPGHTVVIPRVHRPSVADLAPSEVGPVFLAVKKMAERLTRVLRADGLTIGINQGAVSGQSVDHLHIHLLPRFLRDGGGSIHSVVDNPPEKSLAEIAQQLKATP